MHPERNHDVKMHPHVIEEKHGGVCRMEVGKGKKRAGMRYAFPPALCPDPRSCDGRGYQRQRRILDPNSSTCTSGIRSVSISAKNPVMCASV